MACSRTAVLASSTPPIAKIVFFCQTLNKEGCTGFKPLSGSHILIHAFFLLNRMHIEILIIKILDPAWNRILYSYLEGLRNSVGSIPDSQIR